MITPPGRGALLNNQSAYIASIVVFTLATVISAGIFGALTGAFGALLTTIAPMSPHILWALTIGIATAYGVAELRGVRLPVPSRHWQVPRVWGARGRTFHATAFGLLLGPGFFTIINFVGYYVLLIWCVLTANPLYGGALMALFGAIRAVPVVLIPLVSKVRRQSVSHGSAVTINNRLVAAHRHLRWLRAVALLAVASLGIAIILGFA